MEHEKKNAALCVIALLLIAWLSGACAGHTPASSFVPSIPLDPAIEAVQPNARGWWAIRFRMERPPDEIRWEKDLFIAHRIVAPIIRQGGTDIELWRFHRRCNEDATGHQLSFLFYAPPATAGRINRFVTTNPLVGRLLAAGQIREVLTASIERIDQPGIGDTSDQSWSPVMQDNWPYFIMGVCRMWLGMIDQVSLGLDSRDAVDLEGMLAHYRQVNEAVTHIWQHESYHALLHHLNAVFGYEAMVYWEKRWKQF
jgi:hypothetical protein